MQIFPKKVALIALVLFVPQIASVRAEKPASLPDFSDIQLYSTDSPFNQPIEAGAEIDPKSSRYIKTFKKAAPLLINLKQYSAPVYIAGSSTLRFDVELPCGEYWEIGVTKLLDVPIPDWAEPGNDTDGTTAPEGCGEDSDQDNNMVVLDLDTRFGKFQVLKLSKQDKQWRKKLNIVNTGCNNFE